MKYLIYRVIDDNIGNAISDQQKNELIGVEFGVELQEIMNVIISDIRDDVTELSLYTGGMVDVYGPESEEHDNDRNATYYTMTAAIKPIMTSDTTLIEYLVIEFEK